MTDMGRPRQPDREPEHSSGVSGPRRAKALVVLPYDWHFRHDVPKTRGDCPPPPERNGPRLCPHYKCRMNLWHVAGVDRAGRRREGYPPSENTLNLFTPHNCALDVIEAHGGAGMSPVEVGKQFPGLRAEKRMSDRQIRRVTESARKRIKDKREARALLKQMEGKDE